MFSSLRLFPFSNILDFHIMSNAIVVQAQIVIKLGVSFTCGVTLNIRAYVRSNFHAKNSSSPRNV